VDRQKMRSMRKCPDHRRLRACRRVARPRLNLLPVTFNVTQPDYGTGTVHGGWNVTRNVLQTPWFVFTATMPWIASGSLNVVQDFQCTYTVTRERGQSLSFTQSRERGQSLSFTQRERGQS